MKYNRATIPQKVLDLLFSDDAYYNESVNGKKVILSKYPRNDQWVDEDGLHINFALAGYSKDDVKISVDGNTICVENHRKLEESNAMQKGLIVRGIAKRNFSESIYVHSNFDVSRAYAEMKDGLLSISIPNAENSGPKEISIK